MYRLRLNSSTCCLSTLAVSPLRRTPLSHRNAVLRTNPAREASSAVQEFRNRRGRKSRKRLVGKYHIQEINEKLESLMEPVGKMLAKLSARRAVNDAGAVYDTISATNPVHNANARPEIIQKNLNELAASIQNLGVPQKNTPALLEQRQSVEETKENDDATLAVHSQEECEGVTEELGELSIDHFNSVMQANVVARKPTEVERAFSLIKAAGFQPNLDSFNMLIQAHSLTGDIERAENAIQSLKNAGYIPDDRSYNFLMKAYTKNDYIDKAYQIYGVLRAAGIKPTQDIFGTLIKGAIFIGDYQRAWATWDRMRYEGWLANEENFRLMIDVCSRTKETERALNLFQEMIDQGLVPTADTFNQAIRACSNRKDFSAEAFQLVAQMLRSGYSVNQDTLASLFRVCSRVGDLRRARGLFFEGMISRGYDDASMRPTVRAITNLFYTYQKFHPKAKANEKVVEEMEKFSASTSIVEVAPDVVHPESVQKFCFLKDRIPLLHTEIVAEVTKIFQLVTGVQPVHSLVPAMNGTSAEDTTSERFRVVPTSVFLDSYLNVLFAHTVVKEVAPYPTAALKLFQEYESKFGVKPNGHTYKTVLRELTSPIGGISAPGFHYLSKTEKRRVQALRVEKAVELFEEWKHWREAREAGELTETNNETTKGKEQNDENANVEKALVKSTVELAIVKKREGRDENNIFEMYRAIINSTARIENVSQSVEYLAEYQAQHNAMPKIDNYNDLYCACLEDDDNMVRFLNLCTGETTSLEKAKIQLSNKWYGKTGKFSLSKEKRLATISRLIDEQENKQIVSRQREILKELSAADGEATTPSMWELLRHRSEDGAGRRLDGDTKGDS